MILIANLFSSGGTVDFFLDKPDVDQIEARVGEMSIVGKRVFDPLGLHHHERCRIDETEPVLIPSSSASPKTSALRDGWVDVSGSTSRCTSF